MKRLLLLFLLACAIFSLPTAQGAERTGVVAVNILNVRNRPDAASASVVAKLKRGETVRIIKQSGEWVEIVAPESTSVYVYAQFLTNGKTTRDVNLRTGPGVEFQSYGIAPVGTELTVIGEQKNGWLKIKPLPTMSCFASARYIREEKPQAEEKPAAVAKTETAAPASDAAPTEAASPLKQATEEDMKILSALFEEGTAKKGEWEGRLIQVKTSSLATIRYALIATGKTIQPICHLAMTDIASCSSLVGQTVNVKGTMHQVAGWKLPVLVVLSIAQSEEK